MQTITEPTQRWRISTFNGKTRINSEALLGTQADALTRKSQRERDQVEANHAIAHQHEQNLQAAVLDEGSDFVVPLLPIQLRYNFQIKACAEGPLCQACHEAGIL